MWCAADRIEWPVFWQPVQRQRVRPGACRGLTAAVWLTLTGCASIPEVERSPAFGESGNTNPPAAQESTRAGVRRFDDVTVEQVLSAAEKVLRDHLPGAALSRRGTSLSAEYRDWKFQVFAWGERTERWVVTARESDDSTIASVTSAGVRSAAVAFFGASTDKWPIEDSMLVPHEVRASYATFWRRVESAIAGVRWPACDKPSAKFEFKVEKRKVLYETFDPICQTRALVFEGE